MSLCYNVRMILLLADNKPCLARTVLADKDDTVTYLPVDAPSFPASLDSVLTRDDLELAVIECHVDEKACLPLISTIKKRRTDVPVLFITSTDTDHAIAEAFKRGARDCFINPFDLTLLKQRVRTIRSFKKDHHEQRNPLTPLDARSGPDQTLSTEQPESITRVLHFLEDHASSPDLSLSRLARIAGMSPFHFCRSFKKTTGHSPMQYVIRLRIDRAKKLLKFHSNRMSISQIATALGFYDASNLNRHFKRLTGLTPTEFIKSTAPSKG